MSWTMNKCHCDIFQLHLKEMPQVCLIKLFFCIVALQDNTVLYTEALASVNWKGDLFSSKVNAKIKCQSLSF